MVDQMWAARYIDDLYFSGENPEMNRLMKELTLNGSSKELKWIFSDMKDLNQNDISHIPKEMEIQSSDQPCSSKWEFNLSSKSNDQDKNQPEESQMTTENVKALNASDHSPKQLRINGRNSLDNKMLKSTMRRAMRLVQIAEAKASPIDLVTAYHKLFECIEGQLYDPHDFKYYLQSLNLLETHDKAFNSIDVQLRKGLAEARILSDKNSETNESMMDIRSQLEVNGHTYDWHSEAEVWMYAEKADSNLTLMTYCVFCYNNKEPYTVCTSHNVRDDQGRVSCPRLRKYICPKCGQSGDLAHTVKYCPKKRVLTMNDIHRTDKLF